MTHSHRTIKAVDCRNQKGGQIRIFQDEYPYAHVADVLASGPHPASDARRFVAAWNACKGIPTEALEAGVVQEMREALQAMLAAFVWAQDAPPLLNPDGSRTGWQFVATRTLDRVRELLRRSGDPVPDRALARFLGEEAP